MVEADGGTLVLDEIGALPQETQARLDRVLATGEVRPVGCNGSSFGRRPADRHHQPAAAGEISTAGLAERISATTVTIPPLRDRSGDIPALARHFFTRFAEQSRACGPVDRQ